MFNHVFDAEIRPCYKFNNYNNNDLQNFRSIKGKPLFKLQKQIINFSIRNHFTIDIQNAKHRLFLRQTFFQD
jgi:hypothetical protein